MYVVPKTNNKYGDRLISVQLPKILNDLPETMLNLQSLAQVKANLRSWLFYTYNTKARALQDRNLTF
ncbi:hypothetical protein Trydic_g20272 [Trypoxylus dichotomus]